MFNRHLSQSHPPPVHRSEETSIRNPLHLVQNNSSASTGAALTATWPGLVQWIKLTSLIYFIAIIKQRQILHTHTHTVRLIWDWSIVVFGACSI